MIKTKQLPAPFYRFSAWVNSRMLKSRFNKMIIHEAAIKPGHSYLLMCNHFSFLDGLLAMHLCHHTIKKKQDSSGIYVMSVEKQLQKRAWLRYFGSFSIGTGFRKVKESLDYAAELLNTPGNTLIFFPQGNLESSHIQHIEFQHGLNYLVPQIKGNCQILWSSNLVEYFESFEPSVNMHMLDCGTNKEFDFEKLSELVNAHHREALEKQVRFTKKPFD